MTGLELEHIGVVVNNIQDSKELYMSLLGWQEDSEEIHVESQKIHCQYITHESVGFRVQLIEPVNESSPVNNALKKGGGPNHLCFAVEELDAILEEAKQYGCRVVTKPFRGAGVNNRRAAFIYSPELGLTEIVEK